jgi:hypothetical protein
MLHTIVDRLSFSKKPFLSDQLQIQIPPAWVQHRSLDEAATPPTGLKAHANGGGIRGGSTQRRSGFRPLVVALVYVETVKNKLMFIALIGQSSAGKATCYPISPNLPRRWRNYFTSPPLSGSLLSYKSYSLGRMLNDPALAPLRNGYSIKAGWKMGGTISRVLPILREQHFSIYARDA